MGYFSDESIETKYSNRENEEYIDPEVKENMIKVIMEVFPEKEYEELVQLNGDTLWGLYRNAADMRIKTKQANQAYQTMMKNVREFENEKRHGL